MSLQELENRRQLLFTAIDDVKLAVNTEDFSNKVDIVAERGLQFALQTGLLSKNQEQEINDLFSFTIANKEHVISEVIRILGFRNPFNFGPGPQELIGGDMTNGYFGEVSAEELFTRSEFSSLLNVTQGILGLGSGGWLKFARYGNIIYISKSYIQRDITWNTLNNLNLIYGNDPEFIVEKDSNLFVPRLMTGGISDPSPNQGEGSEWNELIYNVHQSNPNQLETPWDSFTSGEMGIGSTNAGNLVICQETALNNTRNHIQRAQVGIRHITDESKTFASRKSWRPVLALKQADGSYSTGREHYPQ